MKKNAILLKIRNKKNMTQFEFATWLGIPIKTYVTYENYLRVPRKKMAKKIITKLKAYGVVSSAIFICPKENNYSEGKIVGFVTKCISEYMSMSSKKEFLSIHVTAIRKGEKLEPNDRPKEINAYTKLGKKQVYKRIADKANEILGINTLTGNDVRLYKISKIKEAEDRTGKCVWGIPGVRKQFGFNKNGYISGYDRKDEI